MTEKASKQKGRPTVCASVPSVPNSAGQAGGSVGHAFAVQNRAHSLQQRQPPTAAAAAPAAVPASAQQQAQAVSFASMTV